MRYIIKADKLSKQFGDKVLFQDMSFRIPEKTITIIHGPSGCGKSTLLHIMGTLEKPTSGKIKIFGKENPVPDSFVSKRLLRYKIGFLFQNYAVMEEETVEKNMLVALAYAKDHDRKQISEALHAVGMDGFEKKKMYTLSGGEQQRCALARLLIKPCSLVLADEPTGNIDPANRDRIMELFAMMKEKGKTIVIVSHDDALDQYADRILYMEGGINT